MLEKILSRFIYQLRVKAIEHYSRALTFARHDKAKARELILSASAYDARADSLLMFLEIPSADTQPTILPPPSAEAVPVGSHTLIGVAPCIH